MGCGAVRGDLGGRVASGSSAGGSRGRVAGAVVVAAVAVGVLWVVHVWNAATDDGLIGHGISPRRREELGDVFTAPFLHFGFGHLMSNTVALSVLAFLSALRGVGRFVRVTLIVVVVGGFGVWLIAPAHTNTAGASILVFGYFGDLLARGFVDRRLTDILVAFVITTAYGWSMLWGVVPGTAEVSWEGHLFGFIGGVVAASLVRAPKRPVVPPSSSSDEFNDIL